MNDKEKQLIAEHYLKNDMLLWNRTADLLNNCKFDELTHGTPFLSREIITEVIFEDDDILSMDDVFNALTEVYQNKKGNQSNFTVSIKHDDDYFSNKKALVVTSIVYSMKPIPTLESSYRAHALTLEWSIVHQPNSKKVVEFKKLLDKLKQL